MERRASIIREGNGQVGPRLLEVVFFFYRGGDSGTMMLQSPSSGAG